MTHKFDDFIYILSGLIFVTIKTVKTNAYIMINSVLEFMNVVLINCLLKGVDHASPFFLLALQERLVSSRDDLRLLLCVHFFLKFI